jgi:hypothetical protein
MVVPLLRTQYRLSRIHAGGDDYQTYNRVIMFGDYGDQGNARFIEGFGAAEVIIEGNTNSFEFRKQTSTPVELYEFVKFRVIGDYRALGPLIRSWLALVIVPFGLDVSYENDVFNCRLRDCDASHGQEIEAYNSTEMAATNTNVQFYDRDVRTVNGQRNMLNERARLTPTPPPEGITEKILETLP